MININQFLILTSAILLATLSGFLSEKVGIINIAINGMMIFGALFFYIFSNVFYIGYNSIDTNINFNWTFLAAFLIAFILGIFVGLLFGFATIKLKCNHIIAGTGINLIAPGIGLIISDNAPFIFRGQTSLANKYLLLTNFNVNSNTNLFAIITVVIALLICVMAYFYINFTKYGLRYKSIGENPLAADAKGINVNLYKWIAILFVGAISSLSGAFFAYYLSGAAFTGDVNGLGFVALALLIVSSWKIIPILALSFIFGFVYVYAENQIGLRNENKYMLQIIPFVLTLVVMMIFGRLSIGPKAVGKHFIKNER